METELTELEGAALMVVRQCGPCTAYRIQRVFEDSPSEFWSGSAGAIYPLVKRLVEAGYLESVPCQKGGRGRPRRTVGLTSAGEEALRRWFGDVERAAGFGFDPLRTRLNFKHAVPDDDYRRLLAAITARLESLRDDPPVPPGDNEEWARAMGRLWLESRLDWLRRAREKGLV